MGDIKFYITNQIGVISVSPKGWQKEINMVSWNGNAPKYDIRDWDPDHQKMGKGITMTEKEARKVYEILRDHFEKSL